MALGYTTFEQHSWIFQHFDLLNSLSERRELEISLLYLFLRLADLQTIAQIFKLYKLQNILQYLYLSTCVFLAYLRDLCVIFDITYTTDVTRHCMNHCSVSSTVQLEKMEPGPP